MSQLKRVLNHHKFNCVSNQLIFVKMVDKLSNCKVLMKEYCANSTFGGVRFIADDTKHWLERLLWLVLVIMSWYGSALLTISAWDDFLTKPISFGVETTYLKWDTKMPAVAVCEMTNEKSVYAVAEKIWPPNSYDLEDSLIDIAYFRGVSYSIVKVCFDPKTPDPHCPISNFRYYADLVRSKCPQMMAKCSFNDEEFSCCDFFQPLETDIGTCFIVNSLQTRVPTPSSLMTNMKQRFGVLRFQILLKAMMYTLNEVEVPSVTTSQSSSLRIHLGNGYRRLVSVRNIENDPLIRETNIDQRACRFNHENKDGVYPQYSYSACTVLCRKRAQVEKCGCNDHFMLDTNESDRCNISGLACIHRHSSNLTTLKPPWKTQPGLACNCLPSCNETEITVVKDIVYPLMDKKLRKKALVEVALAYLPTERFRRNVVKSRLDLVVSIGGSTSLFLGASVVSFVEFVLYFTIRFINNLLRKKHHAEALREENEFILE